MTYGRSRQRRPFWARNERKFTDYKYQRRTANATLVIAIFSIIGTIWSGYLTRDSNESAEKIFGSQIQPWVQAKPVKFEIERDPMGHTFGKTTLKIINFTNFNAFKVTTDIMYQKGEWIREWQQAKVNDFEKQQHVRQLSEEENKDFEYYKNNLKMSIGNLLVENKTEKSKLLNQSASEENYKLPIATGTHTVVNYSDDKFRQDDYLTQTWKGACPSECNLCGRDDKFILTIRIMWENEKGRQFETVDYYNRKCTQSGKGTSFTFIPIKLSIENLITKENE